MATEKIGISIEAQVDDKSFDKAEKEIDNFVNKENSRLASDKGLKLSYDLAKLRLEQKKIKAQLKIAEKSWDFDAQIKLQSNVDRLREQIVTATAELKNFSKRWSTEVSGLDKQFQKVTSRIDNMKNWLVNLWWFIWSVFSIAKVTDASNIFGNMQNALRQVAEWKELDILQKKILETANNARVPVDSLTKSFVRFDLINKQLWWTQQETLTILDSLSKWLTLSWATAQESWAAILQLSQAFGSGVLQGDEFRSVAENLPLVLDILAKKLWVPRWELKKLASEWVITSQVLKEALIEANDEITKNFDKAWLTIWQKLTQIRNDFIIQFWDIDKNVWFSDKIISWLDFVWKALLWFVQTFPTLSTAFAWLTVTLTLLWTSLTLLGWPITLIIWTISALTLWLWYFNKVADDTVLAIWNLKKEQEDNQKAQDNLTKSFKKWEIWAEDYKKELQKLIDKQEDLKKKNQELESSTGMLMAKIKSYTISTFNIIIGSIWTFIVWVWETIWNLFWFIYENVKLIPTNFGIAFNNIPAYIQDWLNKTLKNIQDFINKYKDLLNKLPWVDIKWNVSFSQINAVKKQDFVWVWLNWSNFKLTKKAFWKLLQDVDNFWVIKSSWSWWVDSSFLNTPSTGWIKSSWWTSSKSWKSEKVKTEEEILKEIEKAQEEAAKLELERQERQLKFIAKNQIEKIKQSNKSEEFKAKAILYINENLEKKLKALKNTEIENEVLNAQKIIDLEKKKNEKRKESLDLLKESVTETNKIFDESIDKSKKSIEDFSDKIKDLSKEISDLNNELIDLDKSRTTTLWERNVDILERQKEIQQDLNNLKKEWVDANIAEQIWLDKLKQIDPNSELGWWTVSDLIKILELQKEYNWLVQEQWIIKDNLSQKEIDNAKRISELSPTERFLEEFEKERQQINQKIELRKQELLAVENQKLQEELILQDFQEKQIQLEENYKNKKQEIEAQITDNVFQESQKRIWFLENVRLKALETAEALRQAGVSSSEWWATTNNTKTVTQNFNINNQVDLDSAINRLNNNI